MIQRIRVPLGFVLAALALYFATPTKTSLALGLPIAMLGVAFRFMAAGVIKKDSRLATGGPYGWTRNPLYFGSFLLAVGFAVMGGNGVTAALLLIPSTLIYPVVIRNEEAHLNRLFPEEFPLYQSMVPRFFPRWKSGFVPSFSFAQYLANREYNTFLGFAVAVGAFIAKWLWR